MKVTVKAAPHAPSRPLGSCSATARPLGHLIMGIDPGLSGAIAIYDPRARAPVAIHDMPIVARGANDRRHVDLYQLSALIDGYSADCALAIIEEVSAMPRDGVASAFRFGQATGIITGIVAANYIPHITVRPAVWKMAMGLSHEKKLSLDMVRKLFPAFSHHFARKKDDGRAEALLLAVYASRGVFGR